MESSHLIEEEKAAMDDHMIFVKNSLHLFMQFSPVCQLCLKFNQKVLADEVEQMNDLQKAKYMKEILYEVDLSDISTKSNDYLNELLITALDKMFQLMGDKMTELIEQLNNFLYEYDQSEFQSVLDFTKKRLVFALSTQD
ncbi:hypothetical protein [Radiobacillus sp. PE A8.2]|uniref:hypothetical protein n=1 Tax=Radiobacillus sp. PE A8.2 TaxID=3380349 RepID=UPI00389068B0